MATFAIIDLWALVVSFLEEEGGRGKVTLDACGRDLGVYSGGRGAHASYKH